MLNTVLLTKNGATPVTKQLFLGPVSACIKGEPFVDVLNERTNSAQNLSDKLLGVPRFQTQECDQRTMLYLRLKRVGIISITHPLICILGCLTRDVFNTEAGRQIGMALMRETYDIIRKDMPAGPEYTFRFSELEKWANDKVTTSYAEYMSSMLMDVKLRRPPDFRANSGWMVHRGKQLGIATPAHEAAIKLITKLSEDQKRHFRELKEKEVEERRLGRIAMHHEPREPKAREVSEDDRIHMDRVEKKRIRKAKAIREGLGKQEIPEDYIAPKIRFIGNLQIRRTTVGKKARKN
ncbi:hypothetical protein DL98DRAFT_592644 [Cadophora sp. DSE1049]|nr:hypothetical protein DL98DRAFT_592644 [Cadophora sp. DSE1049]